MTPELQHNLIILEISNNWNFVQWSMYRYREGLLKREEPEKKYINSIFERNLDQKLSEIDQLDQLWINFIMQNGINIESYKNEDEFIEKNLKKLV